MHSRQNIKRSGSAASGFPSEDAYRTECAQSLSQVGNDVVRTFNGSKLKQRLCKSVIFFKLTTLKKVPEQAAPALFIILNGYPQSLQLGGRKRCKQPNRF